MKRTFLLILLLIGSIAAPASACAGDCTIASDLAKRAFETFESDHRTGLAQFVAAWRECPDNPAYAYNVANAYYESGQPGPAETYLRKSVEKSPDNPVWLNNLANLVLENGGDPQEALRLAQKAADLSKGKEIESPAFQITLAKAHMKCGNRRECLDVLGEAKRKWRGDARFQASYDETLDLVLGKATLPPPPPPEKKLKQENKTREVDETKTIAADVDASIPQGTDKRPYDVAVVIGNQNYGRYEKGFGDVKFAERDADTMREYLVKTLGYHPDNIIFKKDAEFTDFNSIFGSYDYKGKFVPGDLHRYIRKTGRKRTREVFVYYSGHGAPPMDDRPPYLVPVNAKAKSVATTCYSLDLFNDIVEKLPVETKTVFLDACFSGNAPSGPFIATKGLYIKDLKPQVARDTAFFCAAKNDQVAAWHEAKGHGLFTYFFLRGLQGAADYDTNREITLGEMKAYLGDEVSYWAERLSQFSQTPHIEGKDDRVIARLK